MRITSTFIVILATLFLSACLEVNKINVTGDVSEPVFELEEQMRFGLWSTISLSEYNPKTNETRQIWLIERHKGSESISLNMVKYGEVPKDFITLVQKRPLKSDTIYVVYFDSAGRSRALGKFKIEQKGDRIEILNLGTN